MLHWCFFFKLHKYNTHFQYSFNLLNLQMCKLALITLTINFIFSIFWCSQFGYRPNMKLKLKSRKLEIFFHKIPSYMPKPYCLGQKMWKSLLPQGKKIACNYSFYYECTLLYNIPFMVRLRTDFDIDECLLVIISKTLVELCNDCRLV
jgi:hypothetical protein